MSIDLNRKIKKDIDELSQLNDKVLEVMTVINGKYFNKTLIMKLTDASKEITNMRAELYNE